MVVSGKYYHFNLVDVQPNDVLRALNIDSADVREVDLKSKEYLQLHPDFKAPTEATFLLPSLCEHVNDGAFDLDIVENVVRFSVVQGVNHFSVVLPPKILNSDAKSRTEETLKLIRRYKFPRVSVFHPYFVSWRPVPNAYDYRIIDLPQIKLPKWHKWAEGPYCGFSSFLPLSMHDVEASDLIQAVRLNAEMVYGKGEENVYFEDMMKIIGKI